jgi:uncharacterized protein (DUF1778 family)
MTRARPRPPRAERGTIALRISDDERALIEAAAASRPTYTTTYMREAAIEAARRDLADAGSARDR